MSLRRRAQEEKPEEPFVPTEPWWRRPANKGRKGTREGRRNAPTFQTAIPRPSAGRPVAPHTGIGRMGRVTARGAAALAVAATIVAGLAFLVTTDRLAVTRASTIIQGADRIPADEIYAASQMEGVNIFQIHAGRTAKRVKQVPGVADAAVYLRLPHEATIIVWEENPIVIWQKAGTTIWVAANGAPVPPRGPAPALKLIDPTAAAGEGERLRPQVLADLKALQDAGLETNEVYYGAREGLYFRSPDGWTVYLGHEGPMDTKLAAFRQLRAGPAARNAPQRIVDLRVNGRAQIR